MVSPTGQHDRPEQQCPRPGISFRLARVPATSDDGPRTAVRLRIGPEWRVAASEHLRQFECVADPNRSGLSHERPHRQAAAAFTVDRSQYVEIAFDPARLRACCHHAPC
jgi:hypothetical protein